MKTGVLMSLLKDHIKNGNTEFALIESPLNNYRPSPPEGFMAFRSNKRRLFIPNHLSINIVLENLDKYISDGIVQELPLL